MCLFRDSQLVAPSNLRVSAALELKPTVIRTELASEFRLQLQRRREEPWFDRFIERDQVIIRKSCYPFLLRPLQPAGHEAEVGVDELEAK